MSRQMTSVMLRAASAVLLVATVWACNRGGGGTSTGNDAPEYRAAAEAAKAGRVAPLQSDSSEDIVSWVDGQVVTDWPAEIARRDRAIEGYLNDSDAERAQQYKFRSGQNPRLAWSWFKDNPVGFNGVPF